MTFSAIYNIIMQQDAVADEVKTKSRLKKLLNENPEKPLAIDIEKRRILKSFLEKYAENINFGKELSRLMGEEFTPISLEDKIELNQKIYRSFIDCNDRLKYFSQNLTEDSPEFQIYKKFYILCLYQSQVVDGVVNPQNIESIAYKIAVLLPEIGHLDELISRVSSLNLKNPIQDLFDQDISACENYGEPSYDLNGWRSLIFAKESAIDIYKAINLLKMAPQIQRQINLAGGVFPINFQHLQEISLRVRFLRYPENPELARVLARYKLLTPTKEDNSNNVFETALKLYENGTIRNAAEVRASNQMPDVFIDIGKIDAQYKGLYWLQLPRGDYRGLILGDTAVICCQSLTKAIPQEVIYHGMSRDNSCFYVMIEAKNKRSILNTAAEINWDNFEENFKIIAESYAYKGRSGSIILDSIETAEQAKSLPFALIMQKFGENLARFEGIAKIIVGSGNTVKIRDFLPDFSRGERYLERSVDDIFAYDSAREQYDVCNVNFYRAAIANSDNFKNFSHKKIYALTSDRAIKCYNEGILNFEVLAQEEDIKRIEYLVAFLSNDVNAQDAKVIKKYGFNIMDLDDLRKISDLADRNSQICYEVGYTNPSQLARLDAECITLTTSSAARKCYESCYCSFEELSIIEKEKIRYLTSENAQKYFNFKQLKEVNSDVLRLIEGPLVTEYFTKNPHQERNKELASALLGLEYKELFKIIKAQDCSILELPKTVVADLSGQVFGNDKENFFSKK